MSKPPRGSDLVLERLTRLHPKIIDLSLGRIETLLARLGHPEKNLAPVVHVAGTNGKGSVIAYLRAMLEAAGQRVQVYTSPHLVRFHERIRLCGPLIEEEHLLALLEECEQVNGGTPITYFEITTAAAFLAFARQPADILLLETGLGGRLDATNVIAQPRLNILTPVSIDHVQYLGGSLAEIAFEKAGILKPGVTAVVGPQRPEALAVIEARAAEIGAPLFVHGKDWQVETRAGAFAFQDTEGSMTFTAPSLLGEHQIENAGLAVAAAQQLADFGLDSTIEQRGLAVAQWPGRLQRLTEGALRARLPDSWDLWLDGGHNAAAGAALAETLATWDDRPLHLVVGMLNSKAAVDYLRPLAHLAQSIQCVAIPGEENTFTAEALVAEAAAAGAQAETATSVAAALDQIARDSSEAARVLICGSLYLAGRVLAENDASH